MRENKKRMRPAGTRRTFRTSPPLSFPPGRHSAQLTTPRRRVIFFVLPSPVMSRRFSALLLALVLPLPGHAAPPPALALALEQLRDQKSYSWEMINLDPGPVAQSVQTRRGTVTAVTSNNAPNVKGAIDLNGDMLLQREWSDGLKLDTFISAKGIVLTNTPEGWMSEQEILTALSNERLTAETATPRLIWLRRADRPDIRRPDEELTPMLKSNVKFAEVASNCFVASGRLSASGSSKSEDDSSAGYDVTVTMNLRGGVIRDYEVVIETSRRVTRSRVSFPVSDHRSVVITYLPKARVDVPQEVRDRLKAMKK
jgi:hypothetical protein